MDILIIDDERPIRRLLRLTLESAGFSVRERDGGFAGLAEAALKRPDAVVLDLGLGDADGVDVLRRLREWSQVPVLVLSVRDSEQEKIRALDAGADDYLTKPFSGGELLARLRAILRRASPQEELSVFRFGRVEVDLAARRVLRDGAEVRLTGKEYELLRALVLHRGKIVTHRQLLREIWGPNHEEDSHYLRVHVTHLRQKIGDTTPCRRLIRAESGIGYRLVVPETADA